MNLAKLFYLMIKIFAYRVVWQVKSTVLKKTACELERKKFRILLGLHVRKLVSVWKWRPLLLAVLRIVLAKLMKFSKK